MLGTWDDHDFGENNAGKYYKHKATSEAAFLDFFDIAQDDPRRHRDGIYSSYDFEKENIKIKVLLLDTRYFRDNPIINNEKYLPNMKGSILGQAQWTWLESELSNSDADVHIFASGIQAIPTEHRFEKWNNFPNERQKLFTLITKKNVARPIIISGDRHIGEISKIKHNKSSIYEITSSSLTHGWSTRRPEANKYRLGEIVYDINYGMIEIHGLDDIGSALYSDHNTIMESRKLNFK